MSTACFIVSVVGIVLSIGTCAVGSEIVLGSSIVSRLADPSRTLTVACPTPTQVLEVQDSQLEGSHFTVVAGPLVLTFKESMLATAGTGTSSLRKRKRGVALIADATTDEPIASFEYFVDRDASDLPLSSGSTQVYATPAPPSTKNSKQSSSPVGSVELIAQGVGSDVTEYVMNFVLSPEYQHDDFPRDAVLVLTSTDAGQRARLEHSVKASSTFVGRWISPLVPFGVLMGLLVAVTQWKKRRQDAPSGSGTKTKKE